MPDDEGPQQPAPQMIRCGQCSRVVPAMEFCVRCGNPLHDEYSADKRRSQRSRFAAAPDEPARALALVSTLFPQLPRAEMRVFRLALAAGVAILVGLALLGLFPVALVVAAVLVPLLMVLYLYVVDIYEDEPLPVIGATMLWGAAAGVVSGLVLRTLPYAAAEVGGPRVETLLTIGVTVPLIEGVLMLAGPLLLLGRQASNDVLDGATFGAASAVSFGGAQLIVQTLPILGAGLRPATDPLPWVVQLISSGVLQPVIAAGSIGALTAAIWLRYRAPVEDRYALGRIGRPVFALAGAASLLIASGLARAWLTLIPATVVLAVLAMIALLWLRRALHLGLLQEAREVEVARSISCPNCGQETLEHTFCGNCGISLRALPRGNR